MTGTLTYTLQLTAADGRVFEPLTETYTDVKARQHYAFSFSVAERQPEGGAEMVITVDDSMNIKEHHIVLDFTQNDIPRATATFDLDAPLSFDAGDLSPKSVTVDFIESAESLIIRHSDAGLSAAGLPEETELFGATAETVSALAGLGVAAEPVTADMEGTTLDFTEFFASLPGGTYSLQLYARNGSGAELNKEISLTVMTDIQAVSANAWARFAVLSGKWTSDTQPDGLGFQYRPAGGEWKDVEADVTANAEKKTFIAELRGLSAGTACQFRAVSAGQKSAPVQFTTEEEQSVPNMGFDSWSDQYTLTGGWDSANKGSGLMNVYPTVQETSDLAVEGDGKSAARLESKNVIFVGLAAGNLYKMDFNEDGEVTRNGAEIVYALASADLNTEGYRDAGYGLTWINSVQTLYANGLTFQYDIANNNNFVHLDPDCTFFVNDSRVNDNEYVEYGTVSAALNALGADHRFTGTVAALINSNGFAQVLILNDTFTGNDNAGAQQGGVVTPGVTVSINWFNQIAVTTTDRVLTDEDVVDEIVSYLTQSGLIVDEPTQTGARTWTFRTYYDLGNGTRIPAENYTFNAGANLTQNITYFLNGVEQTAVPSGTALQSELTGKGELVEVNGTMYDINSDDVGYPDLPATTEVESGKNYVVYSTVTNADGETLTGVVDTKVVDTKADFLSGKYLTADSGTTYVANSTYEFDVANKVVDDDYYKLTINGSTVQYKKADTTPLNISGDYALINDVMMAKADADALVLSEDLTITSGYYKLTVTDATPSVVDSYTWSGDKVVKVGNDYYAQAGDATLTITTKAITATSNDTLTIGGSATLTGAKFGTSNMSTAIQVSGNDVTFANGETWTPGTITVELAVASGADEVTLTWGT